MKSSEEIDLLYQALRENYRQVADEGCRNLLFASIRPLEWIRERKDKFFDDLIEEYKAYLIECEEIKKKKLEEFEKLPTDQQLAAMVDQASKSVEEFSALAAKYFDPKPKMRTIKEINAIIAKLKEDDKVSSSAESVGINHQIAILEWVKGT